MKLKRCPFCNSHCLEVACTDIVWYVRCHQCRATGPDSININRACNYWNGDGLHQNRAALVYDRKSNRDELAEIEP